MKNLSLTLTFCLIAEIIVAQDTTWTRITPAGDLNRIPTKERLESLSIGFGLGLDQGGFGISFIGYPHENFGFFAGAGHAIADIGANAGLKIRMHGNGYSRTIPYLLMMYGTNATVIVKNASRLNKAFPGPTFGFGIDLKPRRISNRAFTSLAILVPARSEEAKGYIDSIGATTERDFSPITISVAVRIALSGTPG